MLQMIRMLKGPMLALVVVAAGVVSAFYSPASSAQAWSLTDAQRRAYLHYYAPVIFKRANENDWKQGYDWILNFDFDQDGQFSTNLSSGYLLPDFVAASAAGSPWTWWRLRPTLYTSLIEFQDGGKNLVLMYHIYHFGDETRAISGYGTDPNKIHDWERVEIHLKNVVGSPGSGEVVNHVVATKHHDHVLQSGAQAKFMTSTTGRHVMLWQAEWSDRAGHPHAAELRFVQDEPGYIAGRWNSGSLDAHVDVTGDGNKNAHYIFVPDGDPAIVAAVGAQHLTYANAAQLASGRDNGDTIYWNQTKRITYELQDIADIIPTHWQNGPWQGNWLDTLSQTKTIEIDPVGLLGESGSTEVEPGTWQFYTSDTINDRSGYPAKDWFWGVYNVNGGEFSTGTSFNTLVQPPKTEAQLADWRGVSRVAANGRTGSAGRYWWQHDYFVHYGYEDDDGDYASRCTSGTATIRLQCRNKFLYGMDPGFWLVGDWYKAENGGFDGRWVQLFDDRVGQE